MAKKFLAFVGSLRTDSFNRHLLDHLITLLPPDHSVETASIADLPLYNQDLENDFPAPAQALKDKIKDADGIIFVTPEFNRSIPGPLKNALDWVSRPYGQNALAGKPGLVLGASAATTGTALAQAHLRQILIYLDMRLSGQPEFYLGLAQEKFSPAGRLTDEATIAHLKKVADTFVALVG